MKQMADRAFRRLAAGLFLLVLTLFSAEPASAQGKIAFMSERDGNQEIYLMHPDGTGQTNLTVNLAKDFLPTISPNGMKIAFVSERDGNREIYIVNWDRTGATRLTNNSAADSQPAFSPDGEKIVFTSNRDGNEEIYVMNSNGTGQTRLTNNPARDNEPSFSADGTKIAFTSNRDGNDEIYLMNSDGSGPTRLTESSSADTQPSFSPDGTKIAFASTRNGNFEIYTMNSDGTDQTRLTQVSGTDNQPSFSPDGSKIAFTTTRDASGSSNYNVYAMNANGTGQTRLTTHALFDADPAWGNLGPGLPTPITSTYTVTKIADTNDGSCDADCSLREAIAAANAVATDGMIEFASPLFDTPQTITLTMGELILENNGSVTISGTGKDLLSISGNGTHRVFFINTGATAVIDGVTVRDGNGGRGGGILLFGDTALTLTNSIVSDNTANEGGGICSFGAIMLRNATIRGNSSLSGGGISSVGTATLTNSSVSDNIAQYYGGGIAALLVGGNGSLTLINSTVRNNNAEFGGGIAHSAKLTLRNSTISHNTATHEGGGILNTVTHVSNATFVGTTDATNSTISNNSAGADGGGILQRGGPVTLINTILAYSTGGDCFSEAEVNAEFSLIEDGLGCVNGTNSNNLTGDPMLGPLQDNGGPTLTHLPQSESTVIDAGSNSLIPAGVTTDQRGAARVLDGDNNGSAIVDMGAVEASPSSMNPRLLNIATRLRVGAGENVLIGGFIITGTDPKKVIIRGIGPSLAQFFNGTLDDPTLQLFQGDTPLASNNDWRESEAEIAATGIPPSHDKESAIVRTLAPGSYTAILGGNGGSTGIGVVEVYDLDQNANSTLANIASRGFVDTGDNVMIGGLIVGPAGGASAKVVVRAIGPSLGNFGIAGALQDPTVELINSNGVLLRANNDWPDSQRAAIEATGLQPGDTREAALVETLAPGNYTAVVRGAGNTTGVGLVEVYNLQ